MGWGEVSPAPLTMHPTIGFGGAPPAGSGPEPRPKMDFRHIIGQKESHLEHHFGIFERRWGLQTSRGPGKLSPPPLDGPKGEFCVAVGPVTRTVGLGAY